MSLQDQLNSIKVQAKSNALFSHRNDSDSELRERVVECVKMIAHVGTDIRGIGEGYRYMGEMEACSELLNQRVAADQDIENRKKEWQNGLEKRKEDALMHLPTAITANAQLIASILEDEDGKTFEEIACWCDELEMLSEEELQKLLNGLVKEGVISLEEGRYCLLCPCIETLICPEEIRNRRIEQNVDFFNDETRAQAKLFLCMMEHENKPLCDTDCLDLFGQYFDRYFMTDEYRGANTKITAFDADWILQKLSKNCMIHQEFRMKNRSGDTKTYYWLKLLGEDEK